MLILAVLVPTMLHAQEETTHESSSQPMPDVDDYDYKQWQNAISVWQIEQLKDGVILVRLSTRKNSIEALYGAGDEAKAKQVEKEVEIMNNAIIQGFKTEFDFCDVYFFESNYSESVKSHRLDEVVFIDKVLAGDKEVDLNDVNFFIAEFTTLRSDTVRTKKLSKYGSGIQDTTSSYYSSSNLGIPGLVVKSDQFIQLTNPFPYYVRTFESMSLFKRSPVKVITVLNKNLHAFYDQRNKHQGKKRKKVTKAESHTTDP